MEIVSRSQTRPQMNPKQPWLWCEHHWYSPKPRENTTYWNSSRFAFHLHCRGRLTNVVEMSSRTPKMRNNPQQDRLFACDKNPHISIFLLLNKTKLLYNIWHHSTYLEKHIVRRKRVNPRKPNEFFSQRLESYQCISSTFSTLARQILSLRVKL